MSVFADWPGSRHLVTVRDICWGWRRFPVTPGRWWRRGVDAGEDSGQPAQPALHVRGPPVESAGEEGHEQCRHADLVPGRVNGQQVGGGHVDVFDKAKRRAAGLVAPGIVRSALEGATGSAGRTESTSVAPRNWLLASSSA